MTTPFVYTVTWESGGRSQVQVFSTREDAQRFKLLLAPTVRKAVVRIRPVA